LREKGPRVKTVANSVAAGIIWDMLSGSMYR
jgi:hypothetical protein